MTGPRESITIGYERHGGGVVRGWATAGSVVYALVTGFLGELGHGDLSWFVWRVVFMGAFTWSLWPLAERLFRKYVCANCPVGRGVRENKP